MKLATATIVAAMSCVCYAKIKLSGTVDRWNNGNASFPFEVRVDRTTISGKAIHWFSDGHSVTVTPHRVDCIRLTNTVDAAVMTVKAQKEAQKQGRKDAKNVEKAVKELEKLRDKSSASLIPLFNEAIKLFEGAKEKVK